MKQIRFFDPTHPINFAKYFRSSLVIALAVPVFCILAMALFGLNWGIDFTGGVEMQVKFQKAVDPEEIRGVLSQLGFEKNQVQSYGPSNSNEMLLRIERMSTLEASDAARIEGLLQKEFSYPEQKVIVEYNSQMGDRMVIKTPVVSLTKESLDARKASLARFLDQSSGLKLRRTKAVDSTTESIDDAIVASDPANNYVTYTVHFIGISDKISQALNKTFGQAEIRRVDFVDGQVSKQLRTDGALAVFYALLGILIYIIIRFDLFFAPGAVVALLQDTFGAMLVFVLARVEFDLPSIAALLTVLGASINNTIVVYDRIRETLPADAKNTFSDEDFRNHVNTAVNDTLSRTINTTLTVLFASVALWLFGSGEIKSFALVISVGLALGAVSSTFAAPAAYLYMRKRFGKKMDTYTETRTQGLSREDKARGVV